MSFGLRCLHSGRCFPCQSLHSLCGIADCICFACLDAERASLRSLTFRPLGADFAAALARQTALESLSVRVSLQGTALRATLNALGQSLAALPTLFKFTMNIESEDDDLRSESLVPWRLPPSLTSLVRWFVVVCLLLQCARLRKLLTAL